MSRAFLCVVNAIIHNKNNDTMNSLFQLKNTATVFGMTLFAVLALSLGACNKTTEDPTEEVLNDEEIVALVEGALITDTEGLAKEASDAVYVADQYTTKTLLGPCGQTTDSTVTRTFNQPMISGSYTTTWTWTVNCNNFQIPTSIDYGRVAQGSYETARMISADSQVSDWTVDNLVSGVNYVLDGTYHREGSQTSKIRSQNTFTSDLDITVTGLNVDKGTRKIVSGAAGFTLSGTGTGGTAFTHEGSLVFNGNGQVIITVNGHTHTIELY